MPTGQVLRWHLRIMMQPERDQRRGGEAELLGAQQAGDRDIAPGLELAVGLQHHRRAQIVQHQRLVGLGNAQFPGKPRVLDRSERRGPGPAGIPGDHEVVGVALVTPAANRPHPISAPASR